MEGTGDGASGKRRRNAITKASTVNSSSVRIPFLLRCYQLYLQDGNTSLYLAAVSGRYSLASLERLTQHARCEVRRAATLAVGLLGGREQIPVIGPLLADSDPKVRLVANESLRSLRGRMVPQHVRREVAEIGLMVREGKHREVISAVDRLVERGYNSSELHCQKSLAWFYLGDYRSSIEEAHQALSLCPYQYTAWIGLGHCYSELGEPVLSLDCFRNALDIYPDLDAVRSYARKLAKALREPL